MNNKTAYKKRIHELVESGITMAEIARLLNNMEVHGTWTPEKVYELYVEKQELPANKRVNAA